MKLTNDLKNWKTLAPNKKMFWLWTIVTILFLITVVIEIVQLVITHQFHSWLVEYADASNGKVEVKKANATSIIGPIAVFIIGGIAIGLGWFWIISSLKNGNSTKPKYFLIWAILLTIGAVIQVIITIYYINKLPLSDKLQQVDKDAITAHYNTYHTQIYTWIIVVSMVLQVIIWWLVFAMSKNTKTNFPQDQQFTMP